MEIWRGDMYKKFKIPRQGILQNALQAFEAGENVHVLGIFDTGEVLVITPSGDSMPQTIAASDVEIIDAPFPLNASPRYPGDDDGHFPWRGSPGPRRQRRFTSGTARRSETDRSGEYV